MSTEPLFTATSDDGATRAAVYVDAEQWQPDGDGYGYVFRRTWSGDGYRWDVLHADGVAGDDRPGMRAAGALADRLTTAYRYAGECGTRDPDDAVDTVLARAAVDWHTFRSSVHQSGDEYLVVVTADHVAAWGCDASELTDPARQSAADWQAWIDGDVYRVELERRVRWQPDVPGYDDRESWESDPDGDGFGAYGYGGIYGAGYAERCARDLLADTVA